MNKIIVLLILSIPFLLSCKDNRTQDRFRVLNESLRRSNTIFARENAKLYNEMENKMHDPVTVAKARIWQPKMEEIKKLTTAIIHYTDSLKIEIQKKPYNELDKEIVTLLFEKQHQASELFNRLVKFRKSIIEIIKPEEFADNPYFSKLLLDEKNEFEKSLANYTSAGLTNTISLYFEHSYALEAITMLDKIQNDVLHDACSMLNYFDSQTAVYHDNYFNHFSAIVTKNTNYLKTGEILEVYAGVGSFSDASKPTFLINGINVPVIEGKTTYQLKVSGKPGNYHIPVMINFTQADGSPRTVTAKVEYTIIK